MFHERFVYSFSEFSIICLKYNASGTACVRVCDVRIIDFVTYFNISFIALFRLLQIEVTNMSVLKRE